MLGDVAHGEDPAEEKQVRREGLRFSDLAKSYLEMAEKRHRRADEEKRIINKDLLPILSWQLLIDIRRRDVRELVENIARKRDAPIMANRTLGVLSRMFNFALDREWIEASPAARIPEPGVEQSRDRVLDRRRAARAVDALEQIRAGERPVDDGAGVEQPSRQPIRAATAEAFQMQLLTRKRPGEVRSMRWADVDLAIGWWSIPGGTDEERASASCSARRLGRRDTQGTPRQAEDEAKFVFENRPGAGSIAHRGKKAAAILSRSLSFTFRAHDLRRTAATRMAEAGVPRDHIARVLNHVRELDRQRRGSTTGTTTTRKNVVRLSAGRGG